MHPAEVSRHPERTPPTPAAYRAAAARIAPYVRRTPVLRATADGRPVAFKLEHLQVTGVFKIRGALNALLENRPAIPRAWGRLPAWGVPPSPPHAPGW